MMLPWLNMENFIVIAWIVGKILLIILPLMLCVAYLTLAERKVIGYMQIRIGPNRVGPLGLLQPFADGLKLLFKELVLPTKSNIFLYLMAPMLTIAPALIAWSVIPFDAGLVLANINAGLLFLFIDDLPGCVWNHYFRWASNSKYALLGALRSAAQVVSYEIPMGFCVIGVLMAAGSMNLSEIVLAQKGGFLALYWLPLLPLFVIYFISVVAETNRAPFDMAEGESEIVAGFHVEYGGIAFALFFLAEYANMILVSTMAALFFLGGWLSPFEGIFVLESIFSFVPGIIWLALKTCIFLFLYLWIRASFPRFRYDQVMRLGWKVFIPVTFFWIVVLTFMIKAEVGPWFS